MMAAVLMAATLTFPDWAAFTPEFARSELPRLLAAAEQGVAAVEASDPKTFEELEWKLNDATRPLWNAWGMVSHLNSVMNSEAWRQLEEDFQPQMVAFSLRVSQSKRLYELAKQVLFGLRLRSNRTAELAMRIRILEHSVRDAELAGVALVGAKKERFNAIQQRLAKLSMDFANSVIDAVKAFKFEKDGKTYTIDDANYPETMKHCADREVREKIFRARATRAPENAARIDEILKLRAELAGILGFANYADVSLATKCAPSVAAALKMIGELDAATAAIAVKEDAELGKGLEPWDRAYAAERLRERKYAYSETELKQYFEFEAVLKGLFRMTKFLFDVDIVEVTGAAKPSVWHPDVRFFEVREQGAAIAHFYVDPYVRPGLKQGGAWMNEFRNRCDRLGDKPLALLALNQPIPDKDGKCYMPFTEVETLFHEFGHATQCMLTRIGEEDAAGLNLIEWDAVEVASQFMENWCLDDRTGIRVPAELKRKVRAAKNFRAASFCRRQLAFAKTDLRLHAAATPVSDPDALKREEFAHFGLATVPEDRFLNAFTHIFAGGYAAGYYGYKWAEVMSCDCYGTFEEAGIADDAAVKAIGRRYRETVLALGGSKSAYAVFHDFRGREPTIDAMLRQQDLK